MSEILQAGQHPDADQLSAFVEHTLPAHEQQQTLAHLALCPDCRQIVALSLPPADESPILQPEPVRHRWLAWVGIPALAALLLVVFFVRHEPRNLRQTSVPSQIADARKPVPPPAQIPPPEALAPLAQRAHPKHPVATGTQPTPLAQARPEPAGGAMGGVLGGIATQPLQPPMQRHSFAESSASVGGPVTALAVDRVQSVFSTTSPLPSHLAILSMASRANQRLAIDNQNHLFLSDDEGRNWKAISSPWKGRAVSVALASGLSAPALKISSHPAAAIGSTLSGTITDPAGAVIPGATLTATNSDGALVGSATTNSHGQYRMEDLAPGSYRIKAQARGFETQSFVTEVAPSLQAVADATLRVGSAAQTVNLQASPAPPGISSADANQALKPAVGQAFSRFELTTDDGERWTSTDGQSWARR